MRALSRVLIAVLLLFPYLIFIIRTQSFSFPEITEVANVLSFTLTQAFLSALASVILGVWGALGLVWVFSRFGEIFVNRVTFFLLLPNLVPALFIILSCFQIFKPFPFGMTGIVILHSLINVGTVSVSIFLTLRSRFGRTIELAYVEGASLWFFFRRAGVRLLSTDLYSLFLYVFSLCFASFSVPLMAGKIGSNTLEVLIYEKIRVDGNLAQAIGLSLVQLLMLMGLTLMGKLKIFSTGVRESNYKWSNLKLLSRGSGLLMPVGCVLVSLSGLFTGLLSGIEQIRSTPALVQGLPTLIMGTFLISIGTSIFCIFGLLIVAYGLPHSTFRWFLFSFVAPSSALVGFAMFLLKRNNNNIEFIYIILGLSILILPVLYRFRWANLIDSLEPQIETARTLGASWNLIFTKLVFPQVIGEAGLLAGLAGIWASGDFAISKLVSGKNFTLAMHIDSLMSSYRINPGVTLAWVLIIVGVSVGMFFWGIGRVLGEKSYS
ncbi:MAG: hypothetical protein SGJ18_04925 [Pseudomonadota bacterium]|nr:hypothetical protein [Pseudomonadota bacterium]